MGRALADAERVLSERHPMIDRFRQQVGAMHSGTRRTQRELDVTGDALGYVVGELVHYQ